MKGVNSLGRGKPDMMPSCERCGDALGSDPDCPIHPVADDPDPRDRFYRNPDLKLKRESWTYLGPQAVIAGHVVTHMHPGFNKVLEIGCSDGLLAARIFTMAEKLPELGPDSKRCITRYLGLDLSPKAVSRAKERKISPLFEAVQHDIAAQMWPEMFDLVLVANVLPWLPEGDVREMLTRRVFERNVYTGGTMVMVTLLTNPTHRSFHGDWPVHQRRARSTFITREPGADGAPTEFVYQLDVVEKTPMKYFDPVLW